MYPGMQAQQVMKNIPNALNDDNQWHKKYSCRNTCKSIKLDPDHTFQEQVT
jgi:hypothetical protein